MRKNRKKTKRNYLIILIIFILLALIYKYCDNILKSNTSNEETIIASNEDKKKQIVVDDILKSNEHDIFSSNTETQMITTNEEIEPHVDEQTGVKYVTYEDFGAKTDEGFDNYQIMKATHEYANQNDYEVRATLDIYHIYKLEETDFISIKTNTDWNNAKIIIHDEDIADRDTRNSAIFKIESKEKSVTITDEDILNEITINTKTNQIEQLANYGDAYCIVYNDNQKQFIRSGENEDSGSSQCDFFRIDNEGNILNEIQWDFENITKIRIIPIPNETLIVQNGNFETILPEKDYEQSSGYYNRNIQCTRSNTLIRNVNHSVDNEERIAGPYFGFIKLSYVSNVQFINSKLYSHKYESKSNYDLILEYAINIAIENIISNDIDDGNRWGITGTNYTKDITYKNCELNRIDAHCGVHNLTIENSEIGVHGISVVGSGALNIINSNCKTRNSNTFINLRSDYGATWNGNINIINCTLKGINAIPQIISLKTTYDNGKLHEYGYDLYLPNVYIDGLKIEDENISEENESLYIFYNGSNETGTDNGDIRNNYNLPQNIIIKNYETTSGRKLKLFYNKFYNNLDELGINLSVPLKDKENVNIVTIDEEILKNNSTTNKDIKIINNNVEGIQTSVKIDNNNIEENQIISNEGNYNFEITYQNSVREVENESINITIDKTAPTITGVENNMIYYKPIILNSTDTDIKELKVYKNDEEIEYALGEEITIAGNYIIEVDDYVGNTNTIKFEIVTEFEPDKENYIIDNNYIILNNSEISKEELITSLTSNVKYNIYRDEEELESQQIIFTGDRIITENKNEYYLIIKGDINKDGIVDITDLMLLKRYLLYMVEFDDYSKKAADLNLDNNIDITDLFINKRILLNM